ncbi:MAG: ABC transporter permease [Spirochaetia bacterium]|jgi:molybdate transport system permease protein|nr:ABC transporter permease [Spirochaetia bacterium]
MSNRFFTFLLIFSLVLVFLFLAIPLLLLVVEGWRGVGSAMASDEVRFSLLLSMWTTTLAAIVCMAVAVCAGYALHLLGPVGKRIVSSVLSLPMALPHLVSGVALLLLYGRNGIGDWLFSTFGIDFVFTTSGVVLALVFVNLSYAIIMMYTGYEEVGGRLEFIARTLGCSHFQAFSHVMLPLSRCTLVSTAVMTWSRALGEFGAVIMIAGTTRMKTEILPTTIFLNMSTGDLDIALAVSVILILVSVCCIALLGLFMPKHEKGWADA